MSSHPSRRKYLFLLAEPGEETIEAARDHLLELGVRVTAQHGPGVLTGLATPDQVEAAAESRRFATITRGPLGEEARSKLSPEHAEGVRIWNTRQSEEFRKLSRDRTEEGKSWGDPEKEPEAPATRIDPRDFKERLLEKLGLDEKEFLERYGARQEKRPDFAKYERTLTRHLKDENLAYELTRIAWNLGPAWPETMLRLDRELLIAILVALFQEAGCWKLENKIAVGVIFVESSLTGGPTFSASTRSTLEAEISDGLDWLAEEAPAAAHLTWVYDWQYTKISAANGTNDSTEDYWRDPAMAAVSYHASTYSAAWSSVAQYREDLRVRNNAAHAIVVFVTPYANEWHGYAGGGRITLANRKNWGGWGIGAIDRITAHEACHLFGASDEYTGEGTPCSGCTTLHGCYQIPNGNCGTCARTHQACLMDQNTRRLCPWTQAHIGWSDLFAELTTTDELWAGTDDDVWLDIGDRTFVLDTAGYDDRERNNRDGYALNYTGVTKTDVKRVGIRKSPDGAAGGWKLKQVRVWVRGELVCDSGTINQWLEDEYRWWASTSCGSSTNIVNRLQVRVTTGDVMWAGTDDDVRIHLAERSWNLDNEGHDDFERGHTDTFNLDPGTGLYRSAIGQIRIHKSPDGLAGGWRLKGLRIDVNGTTIYNNQSINKWLEDDDRDWYGHI